MHSAEALTALLLKLHSGEEFPDQQLHIFLWYGEIPVCHLKKFRESLIQVAKYKTFDTHILVQKWSEHLITTISLQ